MINVFEAISHVFNFWSFFLIVEAKPTIPTNFEETTWATLKSAISAIFLKQPDPCDLEKLYQVHFVAVCTFKYRSFIC